MLSGDTRVLPEYAQNTIWYPGIPEYIYPIWYPGTPEYIPYLVPGYPRVIPYVVLGYP